MSPHCRCELLISIALPVAERAGADRPLVRAVHLVFPARQPAFEPARTHDPVVVDRRAGRARRRPRRSAAARACASALSSAVCSSAHAFSPRANASMSGANSGALPLRPLPSRCPAGRWCAPSGRTRDTARRRTRRRGRAPARRAGPAARVRLHLGVAVGVEQARVVGREDVRDAVAIPQDLGVLGRRRQRLDGRRGLTTRQQHAEEQGRHEAPANETHGQIRHEGSPVAQSLAAEGHCRRTRTDVTQSLRPSCGQSCCVTSCRLGASAEISSESSR